MRKVCLSLATIMLFAAVTPVFADQQISGTILDEDDKEPLAGASIRWYDAQDKYINGVAADSKGNFDTKIPDNAAKIELTHVSYESKTLTPAQLKNQKIHMKQSTTALSEVTVTAAPVVTSGGNGCDKEANDRITAELALCSVHAYNIGQSSNPVNSADKQLMKEVIALKTTVISQQMYKQYEYMESMLKRFRTQLEKAVLLAKLQKAGAAATTSDDGNASGGGKIASNKKTGLDNAEDCDSTGFDEASIFECLVNNLQVITDALDAGNIIGAKQQIKTDLATLSRYDLTRRAGPCQNVMNSDGSPYSDCASSTQRNLVTCTKDIRACLISNQKQVRRR